MKASPFARPGLRLLLVSTVLLAATAAQAQYKSPKQYFRKDSPGINQPAAPSAPGAPGTPSAPSPTTPTAPARPAVTEKPKFKDVQLNTQFYFLNDTNRAFPWTKLSAGTAKNAKGVTRAFSADTLVAR